MRFPHLWKTLWNTWSGEFLNCEKVLKSTIRTNRFVNSRMRTVTDPSLAPQHLNQIWHEVIEQLPQVSAQQRAYLQLATPAALLEGIAVISVPNARTKDLIEHDFGEPIRQALSNVLGKPMSVAVSITTTSTTHTEPSSIPTPTPTPAPAPSFEPQHQLQPEREPDPEPPAHAPAQAPAQAPARGRVPQGNSGA